MSLGAFITDDEAPRLLQEGEFDWDERKQGLILGSFFYGYVGTNFVGGRAAEVLGGRLVFGLGVVLSSLLTVVSPLCAYVSKELFIANRVLQGLAQVGGPWPCL